MIGQKIHFLNAALLLLGQPSEHLAQVSARLGLGELFAQHLADFHGNKAQLGLADLLRQSVYSRLAGYEDLNNAERLYQEPTFRLIVQKRSGIEAPLSPRGCRVSTPGDWPRTRTLQGWRASAGQ
jgi:hypothetical protein